MQLLHAMIRVKNIEQSLSFFSLLGLHQSRRYDVEDKRFSIIYLKDKYTPFELELTYNWDQQSDYSQGNSFGHIALAVNNIYEVCDALKKDNVTITLPPIDGQMAFVKSPDGISIELLQKGDALPPSSFWKKEPIIESW